MTRSKRDAGGFARAATFLCGIAVVAAMAACEDYTRVTNPGPVQDEFLDDDQAQPALVNGIGRAVAQGLNWLGYTGAAVTREIHPSGSTGSFGITNRWQQGELAADDDDLDTHWEQAQRARWLAETGIGRIEETGPVSQALLGRAYLYAGYANRLLGEHYCQAVIDGGAPTSSTAFLTRARDYFEGAITRAEGDDRTAAYAGLASVQALLGEWGEAVMAAGNVPDDFVYVIPYYNVGEDAQRNRIQWASHAEPYKAHTQWSTKYQEVGLSENTPTGDPRVEFRVTDEVGDAAIECCGNVPWWPQQKYADPGDDIPLSKGPEMRLLEAEALLVEDGANWAAALAIINAVRQEAGMPDASATNEAETWTALKHERGVVLWLEGRRMADMRRWDEAGRPGDFHPLERPGGTGADDSHLVRQDLCFPIPPTEQETNPNVPRV